MEDLSPRKRLRRQKRIHPDFQPEDKSGRTRKRASEDLIVIHSDTEDESIIAGVAKEGASNCRQQIDLTNWLPGDISILEERRGRGLTTPLQLGVSREEARQDQDAQKKQVQLERLRKRMQPKNTIATIDLTMPEPNAAVMTDLTNRDEPLPVTITSEVLDLTTPKVYLEVDLTTSEVDLNTIASLNNTLLCPVCLEPLFELDDGRYILYELRALQCCLISGIT